MAIHLISTRRLAHLTRLYNTVREFEEGVDCVLRSLGAGEPVTRAQFDEGIRYAEGLTYDKCGAWAYQFDRQAPNSLKKLLGFDRERICNKSHQLLGYSSPS